MSDPQSNYLKNTIPELEEQFIVEIGKIPLFSQLSHELRHQLFNYSNFAKLKTGEILIERGMFDQEIFVLLQGKLNVLVQHKDGQEMIVDVMEVPFTLFGERSLLGEPRGATIEAGGETFLLGIDLSSLPDILDAFETPETRLKDEAYVQNVAMYSVFVTVLTQRFERLVRDQYKLKQKIGEFEKREDSWKREWWLSRVFNQMSADELPLNSEVREILLRLLKKYNISNPNLHETVLSENFSNRHLHMEMMRLKVLGALDNIDDFIFDSVGEIAGYFSNHPDYSELFNANLSEIHQIPKMTTLSDFLNAFYNSILQGKILTKPLSKTEFLESILKGDELNLIHFSETLRSKGWITNNFSQAYLLYLSCQQCIYLVSEANKTIRDYIHFLTTYNTPKQSAQTSSELIPSLTGEFLKMQEQHEAALQQQELPSETTSPEEPDDPKKPASPQDEAEELLKKLGL